MVYYKSRVSDDKIFIFGLRHTFTLALKMLLNT